MLNSAFIVPRSPHLYLGNNNKLIWEHFNKINQYLIEKNTDIVLSISSSPKVQRSCFSCYINPKYNLDFSDFGDLSTTISLKTSFDLFNEIRNTPAKLTLEPIDIGKIDYSHSFPLYALNTQNINNNFEYLCINDHSLSNQNDRKYFGSVIKQACTTMKEKIAILISGDLLSISTPADQPSIIEKNNQIHQQLSQTCSIQIEECMLSGPLHILSGIYDESVKYTDILFQQTSNTSILIGKIE